MSESLLVLPVTEYFLFSDSLSWSSPPLLSPLFPLLCSTPAACMPHSTSLLSPHVVHHEDASRCRSDGAASPWIPVIKLDMRNDGCEKRAEAVNGIG